MQYMNVRQTAERLDISQATVWNWVRHGYLQPELNGRSFASSAVEQLRERIEAGELDRLRSRANKKLRSGSFIPTEYLTDTYFVEQVEAVRIYSEENGLAVPVILFVIACKRLVLAGEVVFEGDFFSDIYKHKWQRESLRTVMADWLETIPVEQRDAGLYLPLFELFTDTAHPDVPGIIYQSLLQIGEKAKGGLYYTPRRVVDEILAEQSDFSGCFLDPCCGTGQFLLGAVAAGFFDPERVVGFELDPLAATVARFNLLFAFPEREFTPRVYTLDALLDPLPADLHGIKFSLIATNPPWGSSYEAETARKLQERYPGINSGESFSYFLERAFELAEEGGRIVFLLPEAFLQIRTHADIRARLLEESRPAGFRLLGRLFRGVFTEVLYADLVKEPPEKQGSVTVVPDGDGAPWQIPLCRFAENRNNSFDIHLRETDRAILETIRSRPYVTLEGEADWALGIVTGNNKKFVLSAEQFAQLCEEEQQQLEPVYKGADVRPFYLDEPSGYLEFVPELFQQTAAEEYYRAPEKLVYRFISEVPVFAYDDRQSLTLNSANICIPKLDNCPVKVLAAFLNSTLYRYLYRRMFNTRKILRSDLEQLPFPALNAAQQKEIVALVDRALAGEDVQPQIDLLVFRLCGLSEKQVQQISAE